MRDEVNDGAGQTASQLSQIARVIERWFPEQAPTAAKTLAALPAASPAGPGVPTA